MFCRRIDILSPPITLYNKGFLYHSSFISIILSLLCFLIILLYSSYQILNFFFNLENPKISYFNAFMEEAGNFPISPFSFVHFITLSRDNHDFSNQEFDFDSFRIIGFETYFEEYIDNKNLSNFNHWLYGPCENISILEKANSVINKDVFRKSACIKKYYDLNEKKYININDTNFRWPKIEQGTVNFTKKFYSVLIEKCEEDTLHQIFDNNKNKKCKNNSMEDILNYGFINFYFIDQKVNNDNHSEPIQRYQNRIENKLSKENYCINHLYFNPLFILTTYYGILKNKMNYEFSYNLDRNDVNIKKTNKNENLYMGYYLWLNKRVNYYSRDYITLNEVISNIGGVSNVIISIFVFINKLFNTYAMISDSKDLLSTFNKDIKKSLKNEIKLKNSNTKKYDDINKSFTSSTKEVKISNIKMNDFKKKNIEYENNKIPLENEINNNLAYINEKAYKYECSGILPTKYDGNYEEKINNKQNNFNFCKYLIYRISFGKIYKNIKLFEDIRIKIVSVENILKSYFNLNSLIKFQTKIENQ